VTQSHGANAGFPQRRPGRQRSHASGYRSTTLYQHLSPLRLIVKGLGVLGTP